MMTGLAELTIAAARDSLRAGDLTAAELADEEDVDHRKGRLQHQLQHHRHGQQEYRAA